MANGNGQLSLIFHIFKDRHFGSDDVSKKENCKIPFRKNNDLYTISL